MTLCSKTETSLLDSCSETCISVHKLFLKTYFTLILYIVAFCQLFIKDVMDDGYIPSITVADLGRATTPPLGRRAILMHRSREEMANSIQSFSHTIQE